MEINYGKKFKEYVDNVGDYELLDEYKKAIIKVRMKHVSCGHIWEITPNKFLQGRRCPKCKAKIIAEKESIGFKLAKDRVKEISNGTFELIEYKDTKSKALFGCKNCGIEKSIFYNNFMSDYRPCKCNEDSKFNIRREIKSNELKDFCYKNGYELLTEYEESRIHVKVKHLECGNTWNITPSNLKRGYGCPICKQSKGEKEIKRILDELKIEFVQQKTFDGCEFKRLLKFDFYLPSINCCVEFQGRQHYVPIDLFGGEEGFKVSKLRDSIKRKYCKLNNIKLVEIKYNEYDNIQDILYNLLEVNRKEGQ